jgi:hypothetical protein
MKEEEISTCIPCRVVVSVGMSTARGCRGRCRRGRTGANPLSSTFPLPGATPARANTPAK